MKRLLVTYHSRSGSTAQLKDAAVRGARDAAPGTVELDVRAVLDTDAEAMAAASAVLFATSANFGWIAGLTKDLLERVYHPCIDGGVTRACGLILKGDSDVDGARSGFERIVVNGMRWRLVQPPLAVVGPVVPADLDAAWELGASLAAGVDADLY